MTLHANALGKQDANELPRVGHGHRSGHSGPGAASVGPTSHPGKPCRLKRKPSLWFCQTLAPPTSRSSSSRCTRATWRWHPLLSPWKYKNTNTIKVWPRSPRRACSRPTSKPHPQPKLVWPLPHCRSKQRSSGPAYLPERPMPSRTSFWRNHFVFGRGRDDQPDQQDYTRRRSRHRAITQGLPAFK